jgi:hypothetical protein
MEDLVVVQVIGLLQLVALDQVIHLLLTPLKEILVLAIVSVVVEVVELLLQEALDLLQQMVAQVVQEQQQVLQEVQ